MVTGLNWTSYQTQLSKLVPIDPADANFVAILPEVVDYAELRIYQDLDLLTTVSAQTGLALTANKRSFTVSSGLFVTTQEINVITPVGAANPDAIGATRNPLTPTTKEVLDILYPDSSSAALPTFMALLNDTTYLFGPWPDQNYSLEIVGTTRPPSLSAAQITTFISQYLPHIFLVASMIYVSMFQRNFGKISDDPAMTVTYESQYQALKSSSDVEEARRKWQASAWTAFMPPKTATPVR